VVSTNSDQLFDFLKTQNWQNANLLLMTSGNFSGKNLKELDGELVVSAMDEVQHGTK